MQKLQSRLTEYHLVPLPKGEFIPVPEEELRELEGRLGTRLPEDYRWFLKHYGKSQFKYTLYLPAVNNIPDFHFGWFLGASVSRSGVLETYDNIEGDLPPGLVPIGDAGLGDYYLLATTPDKRGDIYMWDHESVPTYKNMDRVASSFTDFVMRLQPDYRFG